MVSSLSPSNIHAWRIGIKIRRSTNATKIYIYYNPSKAKPTEKPQNLPTPEELEQMLTNINGTARTLIYASPRVIRGMQSF